MPTVDRLDDLEPTTRSAVIAPLQAFSEGLGYFWNPSALTLVLRDDDGRVVGGLIGQLMWGWLRIEILAVSESQRGQGWGTALMNRAEAIALAEGCSRVWLDTFSFQARPFYERLGYRVFGELPDYPQGVTRYFMCKTLGSASPSAP